MVLWNPFPQWILHFVHIAYHKAVCLLAALYKCTSLLSLLSLSVPPRFMDEDGELIIDEPFDKKPEQLEILVNRTTRLLCEVTANPPPKITWYKNDEEVKVRKKGHVRILEKGKVLEIDGAEVKDSARYMCIARNLAGETEKAFDLEIQGEIF